MSTNESLAKRFLRKEWEHLAAQERHVIDAVLRRSTVSRDTRAESHDQRDFGQRLADRVAAFGGSWTFILIFFAILAAWTALNSGILFSRSDAFDPYPFIFLNLILSMLAALQAPVIMMSQNRQSLLDREHAEADYTVNLKAEIEIRDLHEKLDELREARWAGLVHQQERQLAMLTELVSGKGGTFAPGTNEA